MHVIKISKQVLSLSRSICREIRKEWYAFPVGQAKRIGKEYEFIVEALYIPEQYASFTHVMVPADVSVMMLEKLDSIISKKREWRLLGMWHSHGDMSVFHSSEDLDNINIIFRSFLQYLPSFYTSDELISIISSEDLKIEPIIDDNNFKGLRMLLGSAYIQIDFNKPINNIDFFIRWYKHFYDIKCMMEVLREYYDARPIVKSVAKSRSYCIMSVVVNNIGDILGEVFTFEHTISGVIRKREKARVETVDVPRTQNFWNTETIAKILERIK